MNAVMPVNCRIYCLGGKDSPSQGYTLRNDMVVKIPHFIHRSREATGKVAIVVNLGTIIHYITSKIHNVKWEEWRKVAQLTKLIAVIHLIPI